MQSIGADVSDWEDPPYPPPGWNELVWLILELRDAEQKQGGSVVLGVDYHLKKAWDGNYNFITEATGQLQEEIVRFNESQLDA